MSTKVIVEAVDTDACSVQIAIQPGPVGGGQLVYISPKDTDFDQVLGASWWLQEIEPAIIDKIGETVAKLRSMSRFVDRLATTFNMSLKVAKGVGGIFFTLEAPPWTYEFAFQSRNGWLILSSDFVKACSIVQWRSFGRKLPLGYDLDPSDVRDQQSIIKHIIRKDLELE